MTLEDHDDRRVDPQDVSVQLNVRVPFHYREQLIRLAQERGVSLNRYVVNALVRSVPPERV
jgi:predicted HicB family RNase H-like nuclease